jgi:hypothetical protein
MCAIELSHLFTSFDELIIGVPEVLPELSATGNLPTGADVIFAGISEKRLHFSDSR